MGFRILVVDDDREIRELLTEFLSGLGHEVTPAASGKEAFDAIEGAPRPFDLAVVDWQMAGISGRDVIEHLRESHPATAILVSTGHTADEVSDLHVGALVAGILRKPFSLRRLARAIDELGLPSAG